MKGEDAGLLYLEQCANNYQGKGVCALLKASMGLIVYKQQINPK